MISINNCLVQRISEATGIPVADVHCAILQYQQRHTNISPAAVTAGMMGLGWMVTYLAPGQQSMSRDGTVEVAADVDLVEHVISRCEHVISLTLEPAHANAGFIRGCYGYFILSRAGQDVWAGGRG